MYKKRMLRHQFLWEIEVIAKKLYQNVLEIAN